jgi:hypothetical protein
MTEPTAAIYHATVEEIELAYVRARDAGVERPVVLVLDLRDDFAAAIATALEARGATLLRAPDLAVFALAGGGMFGDVVRGIASATDLDDIHRLGRDDVTFPCLVFAGGGIAGYYRRIPE